MPTFRQVEESTCRVTWFRLVSAATIEEAEALFNKGQGEPDGHMVGDYCNQGLDITSTVELAKP